MIRRHALATVTLMCLVLLAGSFARAAEDLLRVIPEESLGFAVVNRLAETDAKIQELGRQMQLPVPSLLRMFKPKARLEGVLDEKGTTAIALMPGEDAGSQPVALMFLPVTDYDQFVRKLKPDDASARIVEARVGNQSFVIGNRGGYAVVARRGDRQALETALGSSKPVAADLAPLRGMLTEGDVSAVVTRHGIELLSAKGQEALQQAKTALAALPEDKKAGIEAAIGVFDVYGQIIKALGEEINSYAVAGRIDDGGNLHLIERVRVTPGGQAARILSEVKPPRRDLLTGLPDGPFVFALAGVLPESAGECLMQFSAEIMKAAPGLYGLNGEQVDKLIEISRQSMKRTRGMSMMMGVGQPGDPIYSNLAVVEKVDDSQAFLAEYHQTIAVMNQLLKDAQGSILTPATLREIEVGGAPALRLAMKIPMAPGMAKIPDLDETMKKLFGPSGEIVAFIAAADERTIVASYTSRRMLRESLQAAKGNTPGLAGDPGLAKTAAMLPSGAQWVGYISPKGTIDFLRRVIPALTPEGKTTPKLPEFPQTPPIGFGVRTTRDGLRSHTVVPAEVFKGLGGFIAEIKQRDQATEVEVEGEVEVEAAEPQEQ